MAKICPECGTKNFDDARYCRKCTKKITNVVVAPDKFEEKLSEYDPKGYTSYSYDAKIYASLACVFALLSIFFLPLIFFPIAVILAMVGIYKGEMRLGITAIFMGGIFFIVNLLLAFYF